MNETIIERHNAVVGNNDDVFLVGDVVMGTFAENIQLVSRLRGNLLLVAGNHDRVHPAYHCKPNKRDEFRRMYEDVGLTILPLEVRFLEDDFTVCHFPFEGDSHEADRYVEHRPKDTGGFLVHGHVHEAWRTKGRQFNVGVDANFFRPVHIDTITEWIDNYDHNKEDNG